MLLRTLSIACAVILAAGPIRAAERLTDKDVKALLEQIDHERDRFEDALDGKLKSEVLRGADHEVDVGVFLDDLQQNTGNLKDRFTDRYAASSEVTTVLRQGASIDRFITQQPANFKGSSEWGRLRSSLEKLAEVYSTTFPMPVGVSARRLNDAEVKGAANKLAENAQQFKKALDKSLKADPAIDKPTHDAALAQADALAKDAKTVGSRVGDGKPASVEAQQLVDRVGRIHPSTPKLQPDAQTAWASVTAEADKIAQSFGIPSGPR